MGVKPLLIFILLTGVTFAQSQKAAKQAPSPVAVSRGKREMDGKRWAILTISAEHSYQNWLGRSIRPELEVQCVQLGDERKFTIVLNSGPLQTLNPDFANLRMKVDDAEPDHYVWDTLSDSSSYRYEDYKPKTQEFLRTLLLAHSLLIEFQPFMNRGVIETRFQVGALRREFERNAECGLVESLSIGE